MPAAGLQGLFPLTDPEERSLPFHSYVVWDTYLSKQQEEEVSPVRYLEKQIEIKACVQEGYWEADSEGISVMEGVK